MSSSSRAALLRCAAPLLLVCLAQQARAQLVVNTTIVFFGFGPSNVFNYGGNQTYFATIQVPPTNPLPLGSIQFVNASGLVLATAPLSIGTASGNNLTVAYYDNLPQDTLAASVYPYRFVPFYPGFNAIVNGVNTTWLPSTVPISQNQSFQVLAASVRLNFISSPYNFTAANFTQSGALLLTNLNATGPSPMGTVIVNYINNITGDTTGVPCCNPFSTIIYPIGPNQSNATTIGINQTNFFASPGTYTANYLYIPTSNFTQPTPFQINFFVSPLANPSTTPPPFTLPPPSSILPTSATPIPATTPPTSSNDICTLQVYFEAFKDKDIFAKLFHKHEDVGDDELAKFKKTCKKEKLIFTASVTGLTRTSFPVDGYFTFVLEPYGTVIGEAGIIVDEAQGVGTATIVKDPKEDGIYGIPPPGEYQVVATYSSSSNGAFSPCHSYAPLVIFEECYKEPKKDPKEIIGKVADALGSWGKPWGDGSGDVYTPVPSGWQPPPEGWQPPPENYQPPPQNWSPEPWSPPAWESPPMVSFPPPMYSPGWSPEGWSPQGYAPPSEKDIHGEIVKGSIDGIVDKGNVVDGSKEGIVDHGYPQYGNNYGGNVPDSKYYPKGSYYNGDNQPYTGPGNVYDYQATGGKSAAVAPSTSG